MTFTEYMKNTIPTVKYPNMGNNLYYPTLGLAGEAGEVANKIKKIMRDNGGGITDGIRNDIAGELGDCLWYIAAICRELKIDLEEVANEDLAKLKKRLKRGTILGKGDNR